MTNPVSSGSPAPGTVMLRGYVQRETSEYVKRLADKSGLTQGQVLDAMVRSRGEYDASRFSRDAASFSRDGARSSFMNHALLVEVLDRLTKYEVGGRNANDIVTGIEAAAVELYGRLERLCTDES